MATERKKAPVERRIVKAAGAEGSGVKADRPAGEAGTVSKKGDAKGLRIGAALAWAFAIAAEAVTITFLNGYIYVPGDIAVWLIGGIVVDLIFVVVGSLLWKKANDLAPASGKNKLKFFLWNNMGLIVALVAFVPLVVLLLNNKKLDKKTKQLATIVAAVALVVAGLFSVDWNPVSAEQQAALEGKLSGQQVYWTQFGRRFHVDPDCSTLSRSATLFEGSVDEAVEANRGTPCAVCSKDFAFAPDGSPVGN